MAPPPTHSDGSPQPTPEDDTFQESHALFPEKPLRPLAPDVSPERARRIRAVEKKWVNHTVLHYYFTDHEEDWRGSEVDKQVVRDAFQLWKDLPIGLEFQEVDERRDAEIRIGFCHDDGSWSYVGRDTIDEEKNPNARTMNFGIPLTSERGFDTALHEIGHALGFPHEHQNPEAGIVWNEEAVMETFTNEPHNWPRDKVHWNILRKLDPGEVDGSPWDRDSIMHYRLKAGLIQSPAEFQTKPLIPAGGLSPVDIATVKSFYPVRAEVDLPRLTPWESRRVEIAAGEQLDFVIEPEVSRSYRIETYGRMDTLLVLFEEIDGSPVFLAGDDDSGARDNARISHRLLKRRRYFVRLRLFHAETAGEGAIFLH
ncbi:MAG: M12 family metallopeptidase [Pseudomonadota bacterium]